MQTSTYLGIAQLFAQFFPSPRATPCSSYHHINLTNSGHHHITGLGAEPMLEDMGSHTDSPSISQEKREAPKPPQQHANPSPPEVKPPQDIVDEGNDAYRPGGFHPVYIGDVYNARYKILNKIGYGSYSTVWLVEDVKYW